MRCRRSTSGSGTSPARPPAFLYISSGAPSPTGCRPTAAATGENNYTRFEFRELLERRAARYLMPDVCRANGFSETLKIGHLAAAHQVAVSPHVVHELSLHVVGALSNGFLVEFIDWTPPD